MVSYIGDIHFHMQSLKQIVQLRTMLITMLRGTLHVVNSNYLKLCRGGGCNGMDRTGDLGEREVGSDISRCLKERERERERERETRKGGKQPILQRETDAQFMTRRFVSDREAMRRRGAKLVHQFKQREKRLCDFIQPSRAELPGSPQTLQIWPPRDYFPLTPFAVTYIRFMGWNFLPPIMRQKRLLYFCSPETL